MQRFEISREFLQSRGESCLPGTIQLLQAAVWVDKLAHEVPRPHRNGASPLRLHRSEAGNDRATRNSEHWVLTDSVNISVNCEMFEQCYRL